MHEPERRRSNRTVLEDFTYISVAADNGGSVLNLSEGGLCFTSIAPIAKSGPVPVRFYDLKQQVEAEGEVVWVDATRKTGGLRFTALSAEARDRIRHWNGLAGRSPRTQGERTGPVATTPEGFPKAAAPESNSLAGASGRVGANSSGELAASPPRSETGSWALSGFSRGLLTGLLASLVFAAVFLFHAYRQDFGEWLIRLGEEFAAKPAETRTEPPVGQAKLTAQPSTAPARHAQLPAEQSVSGAVPALVAQPLKAQPQPAVTVEQPQPAQPAPIIVTKGPAKARAATLQDTPHPPAVLPYAAAVPGSLLASSKTTLPQLKPAAPLQTPAVAASEEPVGLSTGPPPQMYFEVGRFKNPFGARETTNRIALLGLPASVLQKGHVFGSSYVVLVGPYNNEAAAEAAHKTLAEGDFNPRPFERGSRTMEFRAGVKINGSNTDGGNCEIRWESYVTEATVKFLQHGSVVATATGRWVPSAVKYLQDAIVVQRGPDGSRKLLEVRFGGMRRSLVLGKPS